MIDVRNEIYNLVDNDFKQFHKRLCPGIDKILGVRVPLLRNLAKEIARDDYVDFIENYKAEYYEEIMIKGLVIGLAKMDVESRMAYIKNFVPIIDNWAICDTFCSTLKFTNKNKEMIWNLIQTYLKSSQEFEIRFAVVMLLDYYICKEYLMDLFQIFDSINHDGYYVKMAVAWAISVCLIKYKEETKQYLNTSNLDDFTYNKALQKAIESYRISKEDKVLLRNMKR